MIVKNINDVHLVGKVSTVGPEFTFGDTEVKINFSVETKTHIKNEVGKSQLVTSRHRLIAWNDVAKVVKEYIQVGDHIAIKGSLVDRAYLNETNSKVYIVEIVINQVLIIDKVPLR